MSESTVYERPELRSANVPARSFRFTCLESQREMVKDLLRAEGFSFVSEPFSSFACRLQEEPFPLGRSLAAFFGLIYIQDRSSMLPPLALDPPPGEFVLDLCASPGSKTGFLAQLIGNNGCVLGNEPNPARLATLRANLFSLNCFTACTCRFPGERLPLPPGMFRYILLDPPCSGWGTVERNPRVMDMWTKDKIGPLVALQRSLFVSAAKLLAPNGVLLFSTCTTNVMENEEQVLWAKDFLGLEQIPINNVPGFSPSPLERSGCEGAIRILPGLGEGQGFFLAKFSKGESWQLPHQLETRNVFLPEQKHGNKRKPFLPGESFLLDTSGLMNSCIDPELLPEGKLGVCGSKIMFMPRLALERIPASFEWQGCVLGKVTGNSFQASPQLRSLMPSSPGSRSINLEEPESVRRLISGNSLQTDLSDGWAGLYYRNLPLGQLRIRGHRALWAER